MEAKYAGMSPYNYAFNNPVMWNDLNRADPGSGDSPKVFFIPAPLPAERSDNASYNPGPNPNDYKKPTISSDFFKNRQTAISTTIPADRSELPAIYNKKSSTQGRAIVEENKKQATAQAAAAAYRQNQKYISQGKELNNVEKEERRKYQYDRNMLIGSQENPLIGTLHFAASDVTGTADLLYHSYTNYREGNLITGTGYLGFAALGISGYSGGLSKIPKGFNSAKQFIMAGDELAYALKKSGIEFTEIGVRGSAVTNISSKGGGFREIAQNGLKASDIDVYIHLSNDVSLNSSKNIQGFIHPVKLTNQYPLLRDWSNKWSTLLGREITPGAFKPGTFIDNKTIKFRI